MEDKKVILDEALKCMFKRSWPAKFLGVLILSILPFIFSFQILLMQQKVPQPRDFMAFFIINTVMMLVSCILYGYFLLYSHDRGLNKNAELRDLGACLPDAFFAGLKWMIGYTINCFLLVILSIIPFLLIGLLNFIPILGTILAFILVVSLGIFEINFMFKLYNHFIKDLKLISWFQWKLALRYNKDCHFGKLKIFLAILLMIGIGILTAIVSAIIYLPPLLTRTWYLLPVLILLFGIPMVLIGYFSSGFWANIFGQYTYNTLETKTGIAPEKIPNIINLDKIPTLIIAVLFFMLQLGMTILAMNTSPTAMNYPMMKGMPMSTSSYGKGRSSNPMENMINGLEAKRDDLSSIVKMKKSFILYDDIAMIYMAEKGKTDVREMFGSDCSNVNTLFKNKIEREVGTCQYIMKDGTYWDLNSSTGEATVSDKYEYPLYTITFGVCADATPNCANEYPEAYKLISGGYQQ